MPHGWSGARSASESDWFGNSVWTRGICFRGGWPWRERMQSRADTLEREIESKREQTAAFHDAQTGVFDNLSRFFNAIIRAVIGTDATGKIAFDGNGLKASVELGGERSTVAIDSLKVIAFDLAVMCMSIEGRTFPHSSSTTVHERPISA